MRGKNRLVKKYCIYEISYLKEERNKKMYRDHNCGELNIKNVGETVLVAGWIQKIRNLGSMSFVDLRDQFGITQIVIANNNELL